MNAIEEAKSVVSRLSPADRAEFAFWLTSQSVELAPGIFSTPGVCGGDPCVGRTRIPVWVLESLRRQGLKAADLLKAYPVLQTDDLARAMAYVAAHREEIDQQIADNEQNGQE
ncbi:MAG: DUF433 domain-containing protein [Verrucomicrobia bacterium]|nr:DUF433 domain-containing protein [Verrucomicrobiota bacterium]